MVSQTPSCAPLDLRLKVRSEFLWMRGGRPNATFDWEGGHPVSYQAGDEVSLRDVEVCDVRELLSICHCLEPLDAAGTRLLASLNEELARPAHVTHLDEWTHERRAFLRRAVAERVLTLGTSAAPRQRKGRPWRGTTGFDLSVKLAYDDAERQARAAYEENSREPRDFGAVAMTVVTRRFGTTARTVQRILRTLRGPRRRRRIA